MRRAGHLSLMTGLMAASLTACSAPTPPAQLPLPISNNAAAIAETYYAEPRVYSFYGLEAGKGWQDVSTAAFVCQFGANACRTLPPPPVDQGRLASAAVSLNHHVYIFGGYTVTEDGSEVSTPEVFKFDITTETYTRAADMPTPVDDMTAFEYAGRYIYLVSGWHDTGNVNLVQVYDTEEDKWFRATDYPGAPVFGHAGGIAGNQIVIADGVAVTGKTPEGRRQFGAVDDAWQGIIDLSAPSLITWRQLPAHPGKPLYRMAATGDYESNRVVFAGGSDNPYNFNGIGYDGNPAAPSDKVFAYDFEEGAWTSLGEMTLPTMDHRALLRYRDSYYTLGGMGTDQALTANINLVYSSKGRK